MQKSLVFMPKWLGDCILALTVVAAKQRIGKEELTLLVPEALTDFCKLVTPATVISFPKNDRKKYENCIKKIRAEHFSAIYLLPYSFSSGWFSFRTKIPKRRGIQKDCRGFLLSEPLPVSTRNYSKHILHEYATILDTTMVVPQSWEGYTISPDNHYKDAIVICPGAQYGPSKHWPGFTALLKMIPNEKIVILGRAEDALYPDNTTPPVNCIDLTGKTTLSEAAKIIAGAKCVVSNDSGLMHLAGYLGAPVIGIFGSTNPAWTSPVGKKTMVIYKKEPCSPCFKRTCIYGHYNCLQKISAQDVYQILSTHIAR